MRDQIFTRHLSLLSSARRHRRPRRRVHRKFIAKFIVDSHRSPCLSVEFSLAILLYYSFMLASPTSFTSSELLKSLTSVVVKQRFVVSPQLTKLLFILMLSNSRPSLCLRHSAFTCLHNIRRERGIMSQWMSAIFLGTSSGGGPTESRNCSSLVLDIVGDGSLWSSYLCPNHK